jgi:hypothetical protein
VGKVRWALIAAVAAYGGFTSAMGLVGWRQGGAARSAGYVVVAAVVCVAVLVLWTDRDHDGQLRHGLLAFVLAGLAVAVPLAMLHGHWLSTWQRVALSVVAGVVAVAVASTNWVRPSLRVLGSITVGLVLLLVVQIGREAAPSEAAMRETARTEHEREALEAPRAGREAKIAAARTETLGALQTQLDSGGATSALVTAASVVAADLGANRAVDRIGTDRAAFDRQFPTSPTRADANLRDALDAAISADVEAPTPAAVEASITNVCVIARHEATPPGNVKCLGSSNDVLTVAIAEMRLELATYRNAVLARPEDAKAVTQATNDLAAAQADVASGDSVSVVGALQAGGNALIASLPWEHHDPPLEAQTFGWTLLLLAVVIGWRAVERRSAQTMPGPVSVDLQAASYGKQDDAATPPELKAAQTSAFRAAVLVNVREPSTAPGTDALTAVTNLGELGGAAGTALASIATALKAIVAKPGGYTVHGEVIPSVGGNPNQWRVLTRVNDAWTDEQVAVATLHGATSCLACRAAGYWAAAVILSRSVRVPDWATWSAATADSLALYHETATDNLAELERAVKMAPTSGVLLVRLAGQYDLAERTLEALTLYARAVTTHPRYLVARYRLAVSAGSLGADGSVWAAAPAHQQRRVALELSRACHRLGNVDLVRAVTALAQHPAADPDEIQAAFRALTRELYQSIENDVRWPDLLAQSFRRRERSIAWQWLWRRSKTTGPAAYWRWLARSARLVSVEPAGSPPQLEAVEAQAKKENSSWQLSYNVACYYARNGRPDAALGWLETALERPASYQLTGWAERDPDLAAIRHTPRFEWVMSQVDAPQKGAT